MQFNGVEFIPDEFKPQNQRVKLNTDYLYLNLKSINTYPIVFFVVLE